jgi:hypothetical protein
MNLGSRMAGMVLTLAAVGALAQTPVPPPPKPADPGPSRETTMTYIQDRLNATKITWSELEVGNDGSTSSGTVTYAVYEPHADAESCTLKYRVTENHKYSDAWFESQSKTSLSFRDIRSIAIFSASEEIIEVNKRAGLRGELSVSPPLFGVRINMIPGRKVHGHDWRRDSYSDQKTEGDSDMDSTSVDFLDEDLANRFAKALNHAAELCGAVDNDPFK